MFLHFLAGLLLNRTFLATPGPTQRWTSLTAFPVVCVCVCVFFFLRGGGGGGGGFFFKNVFFFFGGGGGNCAIFANGCTFL